MIFLHAAILLLSALFFHLCFDMQELVILYLLFSLAAALLLTLCKHRCTRLLCWGVLILSAWFPSFLFYLPFLLYVKSTMDKPDTPYLLSCLLLMLLHIRFLSPFLFAALFASLLFAVFMQKQDEKMLHLQSAYQKQRDSSREMAMLLQKQNKELQQKNSMDMQLSALDERNRIAREIHDNVGHLLSSALLQLGALEVINKEELLHAPLMNIKDTLSEGMRQIRQSVHDLHDSSIDLNLSIKKLIQEFTFCPCSYSYDIYTPLPAVRMYELLAVIKECMNNTMRHSNATLLTIIIKEQPSFYQMIIRDNGTKKEEEHETGIGLQNMKERIRSIDGYLNITNTDGFCVHITLPKEEAR